MAAAGYAPVTLVGATEEERLANFERFVIIAAGAHAVQGPEYDRAVALLHGLSSQPGAWVLLPKLLVGTKDPVARFYALLHLWLFYSSAQFAELSTESKAGLRAGLFAWVRDTYAPTLAEADDPATRNRLGLLLAMLIKVDYPANWPTAIDDLTAALIPPAGVPVLSRPGSVYLWTRMLQELDDAVADPRLQALRSEVEAAVGSVIKDRMRADGTLGRVASVWGRILTECGEVSAKIPPAHVKVPTTTATGSPMTAYMAKSAGFAYGPISGDGYSAPIKLCRETLDLVATWTSWADAEIIAQPALLLLVAKLAGMPQGGIRVHAVACLDALARKGMTGPQRIASVSRTGLVDAVAGFKVLAVDKTTPEAGQPSLPPPAPAVGVFLARVKAMSAHTASGGGDGSGLTPTSYSSSEADWAVGVCSFASDLCVALLKALVDPDTLRDPALAKAGGDLARRCALAVISLAVSAPPTAAVDLRDALEMLAARAGNEGRAAAAIASGGVLTLAQGATVPTTGIPADAAALIRLGLPAILPSQAAAAMQRAAGAAAQAGAAAGGGGRGRGGRVMLPLSGGQQKIANSAELARASAAASGFSALALAEPLLDAALALLIAPASHIATAADTGHVHGYTERLRHIAGNRILGAMARGLPVSTLAHVTGVTGPIFADVAARGNASPWMHAEAGCLALLEWSAELTKAAAKPSVVPGLVEAVGAMIASKPWLHANSFVAEAAFLSIQRYPAALQSLPAQVPEVLAAMVGPQGMQCASCRRLSVLTGSQLCKLLKALCNADGAKLVAPHANHLLTALGPLLSIPTATAGDADAASAPAAAVGNDTRIHAFEAAGIIIGQPWVTEADRSRFAAAAIAPTLSSLEAGVASLTAMAPPGAAPGSISAAMPPATAAAAHSWCANALGAVGFLVKGLPPVSPGTTPLLERIVGVTVAALTLFPGAQPDTDTLGGVSGSGRDVDDLDASSAGSGGGRSSGGGSGRGGRRRAARSPVRDRVRFMFQVMVGQLREKVLPLLAPALPILFACETPHDMGMVLRLLESVVGQFRSRAAPLLRGGALPALLTRVFSVMPPAECSASSDEGRERQELLNRLFVFLGKIASDGPDLAACMHDTPEAAATLPRLLSAVLAETVSPSIAGSGTNDASQRLRKAGVAVLSALTQTWWPDVPRPTEPPLPASAPAYNPAPASDAAALSPALLASFKSFIADRAIPQVLMLPVLGDWSADDAKSVDTAHEVALLQLHVLRRCGSTGGGGSSNAFATALATTILPRMGVSAEHAGIYASTLAGRAAAGDWEGLKKLYVDFGQLLQSMAARAAASPPGRA